MLRQARPPQCPQAVEGGGPPAASWESRKLWRRFSVDLTEKARKGEIDPIVGRDRRSGKSSIS